MKLLIVISMLASSLAFASETKTECPWISDSRINKKAGQIDQMTKSKSDNGVKANTVPQ